MPSRVRFVSMGLALAVVIALAWAPSASTQGDESARIDVPADGASVIGAVEVRGRATTADPSRFSFYRLHYGAGAAPPSLRPVGPASDKPVENGVLGIWDTAPLFQGEHLLQLTVYDTSGGTTTARVVVNVLPAPTPTSRNQPELLIPVPGQTPTPGEEGEGVPTATPLPELPQLDPQIPYIEVPQQYQPPPPIQPVDPPPPDQGFQPIQIDPGPRPPAPPPPLPGAPQPSSLPPFDPGPSLAPQPAPFNPVNPVGPPPPPVVAPYEAPPTVPAPPTPTLFGLPP